MCQGERGIAGPEGSQGAPGERVINTFYMSCGALPLVHDVISAFVQQIIQQKKSSLKHDKLFSNT